MSSGNNFFDDVLDIVVQGSTFGLVGYDGKGKVKAGTTGKPAMDVTKEITGAKAAEEANEQAREQFNKDVEAARKQREDMQWMNQQRAIANSNNASSARSMKVDNKTVSKIGDTSDFLGL